MESTVKDPDTELLPAAFHESCRFGPWSLDWFNYVAQGNKDPPGVFSSSYKLSKISIDKTA